MLTTKSAIVNILKLETGITYTLVAFHKLEIKMGFLFNRASIDPWGSSVGIISKLNKETYEIIIKPFELIAIFQNLAST
jgi:hypothetical protein